MADFLSVLERGPEGRVLVVTRLYYPIRTGKVIVDAGIRLAHGRLIESRRLPLAEFAQYMTRCPSDLTLVWEVNLPIPPVLKDYLWTYPSDQEVLGDV